MSYPWGNIKVIYVGMIPNDQLKIPNHPFEYGLVSPSIGDTKFLSFNSF